MNTDQQRPQAATTAVTRLVRSVIPASVLPGPKPSVPSLPMPPLAALPRSGMLECGMARVDASGRISDRYVVDALSWHPGTTIHVGTAHGLILIRPDRDGSATITEKTYVAIPAAIRARCGITAGDRVLLVAVLSHDLLIAYPHLALETMLLAFHDSLDPTG